MHIINKDRLDILNRLREAEDLGLVIDRGDEDDIYEFSSRSLMKEIRYFGMKKKGVSKKQVSQVVKEYNDRILNYFYELKDFDLQKLDINLLMSLADRSYENNISRTVHNHNPSCLELNQVAGKRTLALGKYRDSLRMYENLKKLAERFNNQKLKIECLLVIVKCYINTEQMSKALEMEKDLRASSYSDDIKVKRDLLVAKLCIEDSREGSEAFDLLSSLENNPELDHSQEIELKMLLAELYDYKEEDNKALALYNKILEDVDVDPKIKTNVLYKVSGIFLQHSKIKEAYKKAEEGYKSACEQNSSSHQADFLFELLTISLRRGNKNDFEKHTKDIISLSEQSSVNITNQLSVLLSKFVEYVNNSIEYSDIDPDIDRLLKMTRYNGNFHKETQVLILKIIVDVLEGNYTTCISLIEDEYLSAHKLEADKRMRLVLTLLYTDLSILNGKGNFNYFNQIGDSDVKEIPTLLPKFNYLLALKDGANIIDASKSYLDDIKDFDIYLMAEELPFSIKLSNNKVLINDILSKYFLTDRLNNFLND